MNAQMPFGTQLRHPLKWCKKEVAYLGIKLLEPVLAVAVVPPERATASASRASVATRSWRVASALRLVGSESCQLFQTGNTPSRSAPCIPHTPRAHGWHMSRTNTLHQHVFRRHRRVPTTSLNRRMGRAVWAKQYGWSSYTRRYCHVVVESRTSDVPNNTASSTTFHRSFGRFLRRVFAPSTEVLALFTPWATGPRLTADSLIGDGAGERTSRKVFLLGAAASFMRRTRLTVGDSSSCGLVR
jgi:hypothetical protein